MERVEVGFSPPLVVPRKAAQVSAQRAWASPPRLTDFKYGFCKEQQHDLVTVVCRRHDGKRSI
jgi:hypothetical protein